ncbi:Serine/threonine protein kinase [Operophtera brumata]|uniref:Serine/threonine protein kinase n=1 Tax=Operophtera brumata TaxID=104452 RepID=A0A0L7L066_OPEBR|nr:Serine/threonine protein kinase [Operophtera brumata]
MALAKSLVDQGSMFRQQVRQCAHTADDGAREVTGGPGQHQTMALAKSLADQGSIFRQQVRQCAHTADDGAREVAGGPGQHV